MKADPSHTAKPPRSSPAHPVPRPAVHTTASAKAAVLVYHMLVVATVLLALLIAAGTIYALVFRSGAEPLYRIPTAPEPETPTAAPLTEAQVFQLQENIFTNIGRLRALSADKPPVTIVVSIAFPFPPEDRAFAEELASKVAEFRNTALEYFSSRSAAELRQSGEETIKAEILHRYNNLLHLGNISILYFNDLMFID
jgi:flagellar basal body-associated protein FliL